MYKIFVTRKIDETGLNLLKQKYSIVFNNSYLSPSKQDLIKGVKGVDAILCTLSEKIDSDIMDEAGNNLKVISTYSTGYEHVDIEEASRRGIYVTNTGNILAEATADLTFALILAVGRRIVEGHKYVVANKWKSGWMPNLFVGKNIFNSTLGILGLGNIGFAVARRAKAFKMKVIYNNRHRLNTKVEKKLGVKFVDKVKLFQNSDFLSIHVNLQKENYHLVSMDELKMMKKTAFLINTSRGSVIDEKSLTIALDKNWISGAGLDVFETEPIKKNNPLLNKNNVIILPHIGSASKETRAKMSQVAGLNIINILEGKRPLYLVNKQLLRSISKKKSSQRFGDLL
ncbi:MAG: D-glycerate dehydrogenase [Nitrososphaeraceae archaeon]|nr:D-glycerate dehydrogenase [Nitrososphaeraceae archaeon]